MSFFPEYDKQPSARPATPQAPRRASSGPRRPSASVPSNPCVGCPAESHRKAPPTHRPGAKLVALGMGPGAQEEVDGRPFTGPTGKELRSALEAAGLDPERDVAYCNLARCRPPGDDFGSSAWKEMAKRCAVYLARDLAPYAAPLLLLGTLPVRWALGDSKARIGPHRGLWLTTADGRRQAFAARHPGEFLRQEGPERERLTEQFRGDVARCAARVLGTEVDDRPEPVVVTTLAQVAILAQRLARHRGLWVFDIEAFDGAEFPSRREVATDPCHPDFRLRGVAVAWSPTQGAWLELAPLAEQRDRVRAMLSPAFLSPAPKGAFNGSYDEEGLIVPGWVDGVANRAEDPMLGMVALGNGQHESLKLEKAVVDLLGHHQSWQVDKQRMRDLPLREVARGAVGDACRTLELCLFLRGRLEREEYL